jgi:hypothetical protein
MTIIRASTTCRLVVILCLSPASAAMNDRRMCKAGRLTICHVNPSSFRLQYLEFQSLQKHHTSPSIIRPHIHLAAHNTAQRRNNSGKISFHNDLRRCNNTLTNHYKSRNCRVLWSVCVCVCFSSLISSSVWAIAIATNLASVAGCKESHQFIVWWYWYISSSFVSPL